MARWRCSCPVCRLLVHPVLRRLGAVGEAGGPSVARREAAAAPAVGETEVSPLASPAGPSVGEEEAAEGPAGGPLSPKTVAAALDEELLEGFASKISASIREVVEGSNKVLLERLDRIEENVGKLRKEIRDLVSSMENVIVEFREALGELSNPLFAQPGGMPGTGLAQAGAPAAQGLARLEALVESLATLVEKAGLDAVLELIDEYVRAGLLSEEEARKLKAIAKTVARLGGKVEPRLLLPILAGSAEAKG